LSIIGIFIIAIFTDKVLSKEDKEHIYELSDKESK